jgi:CheY-like chemotaxis protein
VANFALVSSKLIIALDRRSAMRVLIVDNDHDTADMLALLLTMAGCDARAAYDPLTCLGTAEIFEPDLLVADLSMPTMDGVELARRIRQSHRLDKTVLAAVTGTRTTSIDG